MEVVDVVETEEKEPILRRIWTSVKEHPDLVVNSLIAAISFAGSCIYSAAIKSSCDDFFFTELENGEIGRVPYKHVKQTTKKGLSLKKSI